MKTEEAQLSLTNTRVLEFWMHLFRREASNTDSSEHLLMKYYADIWYLDG